jgi:hypothetical protein
MYVNTCDQKAKLFEWQIWWLQQASVATYLHGQQLMAIPSHFLKVEKMLFGLKSIGVCLTHYKVITKAEFSKSPL